MAKSGGVARKLCVRHIASEWLCKMQMRSQILQVPRNRLFGNAAFVCAAFACLLAPAANAQSAAPDYFKQSVSGAFVYDVMAGPNRGLSTPMNNAPGYSVNYWFRPHRHLALEAGFQQIVRPIGSTVCCRYSTNADDELFLVPFGVRYVWESRSSRLRLTIGGGGAYLNHSVGNRAGDTIGFAGWGGQFAASGDYAVTRSGRLRAGLTARYYFSRPKPSEDLFAPFPTPDDILHILVIGPEVTFSFR